MNDTALKILKDEQWCVITTSDSTGQPEAAFVGFSVTDDLLVTIITARQSRKYENMLANPKVALVFCFDGTQTLQYEGVSYELSGQELVKRRKQYLDRLPNAKKYGNDPKQAFIGIRPSWLRISTSGSRVLEEMSFK